MEERKLQLTMQDLEDIRFALLIAASEARDDNENKLAGDLCIVYDKIATYLEYQNIPERK